jgi:hypothetical protein
MRPQFSMDQLEAQADRMAQHMPGDELDQHRSIDAKNKDLKSYQFDTKLREIVNECVGPLRARLILNNEQIAGLSKGAIVAGDKIDQLETVYLKKGRPNAGDVSKPQTIFD